jgi:methylated-DNA-protein-cysteine methyltransferase related protein
MKNKDATYIEDVMAVTRFVPRGRVTTYGAIATYLHLGSPRMVGWALRLCGTGYHDVPAHRVVNSKGFLSGRNQFATPTLMQERLESEGIAILNGEQVADFKQLLWEPLASLE